VQILGGEMQYGDWTTDTATFVTVEYVGEVSSYGDYNTNGMNSINLNFPQRQSYGFQTFTQWGEKQLAKAALARVDYAAGVNKSSIDQIARFFNTAYFFGISGLQNYGLLNDPGLAASIVSAVKWNASATTAIKCTNRFAVCTCRFSTSPTARSKPTRRSCSPCRPVLALALTKTNSTTSTCTTCSRSFPNIRFETAVQYGQATGGELVQMIVESVNGVKTATPGFHRETARARGCHGGVELVAEKVGGHVRHRDQELHRDRLHDRRVSARHVPRRFRLSEPPLGRFGRRGFLSFRPRRAASWRTSVGPIPRPCSPSRPERRVVRARATVAGCRRLSVDGERLIRPGYGVTLFRRRFLREVRGRGLAAAARVRLELDGAPISGEADDAEPTPWYTVSACAPGGLAIISTWSKPQ
jgi:hypothetical protein